jgi:hypothetical protein
VDTLGYDSAEVVVVAEKHLNGRLIGSLRLLEEDSVPRPDGLTPPHFACTSKERACEGGYLALATPNAEGKTTSRLLLLSAILGVLAAIFAQQLIQWTWPLPREGE